MEVLKKLWEALERKGERDGGVKREGKSGEEKEEKKEEGEVGKRRIKVEVMSKEEDEEKLKKLKEEEDVICLERKIFCVVLSKENNVWCHGVVDEEEESFVDEEVVESGIYGRGGDGVGEVDEAVLLEEVKLVVEVGGEKEVDVGKVILLKGDDVGFLWTRRRICWFLRMFWWGRKFLL